MMTAAIAVAHVEIRPDTKNFKKQLNTDVAATAHDVGKTFSSIFAATAFAAGIRKAIMSASDLNETMSKTKIIFGDAHEEMVKAAEGAATALGMSKKAYLDAATNLKGLLDNLGLTKEMSQEWAGDLVQLGGDLASFFNTAPADAIYAITAALRGESEPIRRYNVSLNEMNLKQKALELGLYAGKGALDANAKAQAALALIMEQTSSAQGDFARTADGAANSMRITAAQTENASAEMGQNFLPIYTRVVQVIGFLAEKFGDLPGPLQVATVALMGMIALARPLSAFKDLLLDLTKKFKEMGATAQGVSAGIMAFAAVTLVAFSLRAKQAAEGAKNIADAIAEINRGTDTEAMDAFNRAIANMLVHGQHAGDMLGYLAAQNLEGTKRIFDLKAAQGASIEELQLLAKAIYVEERARDQAAKTQEEYGEQTEETTDAIEEQQTAVDDLALAFKDLLGTLDINDAARSAMDSVDDVREAWAAMWDEANTPEETKQAQRDWEQSIDDAKRRIIAYGDTLDGVADKERIADILTLLDEGKLDEAEAALDALTRAREVRVKVRVSGNTGIIQIAGAGEVESYAEGGIVESATFLAGEAGREAVLPLTRPSRLGALLRDERIRGPVMAALNSGAIGGDGGSVDDHSLNIAQVIVGSRDDLAATERAIDRILWRVSS